MPSTTSWPGLAPPEPSRAAPPPTTPADPVAELAERLGGGFGDLSLLRQAMAHRSWCGETNRGESNERLEFLGDAVLGLVVAEHAYERFPELAEGALAKMRAAVVNARVLAEVAEGLGLGSALLLGRGEEASGGRSKASILADALEAVLGAIYLERGFEAARAVILCLLGQRIEEVAEEPDAFDHKSRLQELSVQRGVGMPRYVLQGSGPDHGRHYLAQVFVGGELLGTGEGTSKKDAEQQAAARAFGALAES